MISFRAAKRAALIALCLGSALVLSACNELADDSYTAVISSRGQWRVSYSNSVDVELTQGEVIHLYSVGQNRANIKVSGNFHFAVHGCGTVKAENNAVVDVYDCQTVKAMTGTTLTIYNCETVLAEKNVPIEVHGRSNVRRFTVGDQTGNDTAEVTGKK